MTVFVDTSVWSLAFRRNHAPAMAEVEALRGALVGGEVIVTHGIVVQELLQGFAGARARTQIIERFSALPLIPSDRQDHVDAAELHNRCRRSGLPIGTIDALIAQLCIRHDLTLLTTDQDFTHAAAHCPLRLWRPAA